MTTLDLSCACGQLTGSAHDVSPRSGNRLVCMCDDCQAFATYLGREPEVLDVHGGTEIFQFSPAKLNLHTGIEQLRCVRLSAQGMLRWYAGCCNTPIANTMPSSKVPFVGIVHAFMRSDGGGTGREAVLGPVKARIYARFARGQPPSQASDKIPFYTILRTLKLMLRGLLTGQAGRSPFFDPATGDARCRPKQLTPAQRDELRPKPGHTHGVVAAI